jgi:hypothetical protein
MQGCVRGKYYPHSSINQLPRDQRPAMAWLARSLAAEVENPRSSADENSSRFSPSIYHYMYQGLIQQSGCVVAYYVLHMVFN